jgi:hypothetical protein
VRAGFEGTRTRHHVREIVSPATGTAAATRAHLNLRRAGLSLFAVLLLAFAWHSATHAIDFPVYYRAGSQILHGDYNLYPRELYDSGVAVSGHGFRYAPAIALFFVPFALLPLEAAAFVFFCLKIAAFLYIFATISRRIPVSRGRLIFLTVLVTGGYLVEEFRNGNFHFFSVFLMVFAFDEAERRKVWLPGGALAIAIAAKVLPAVLLGYWMLRRRFAAAGATLVALVLLWLLPAAIVGMDVNNQLTLAFARFTLQKVDEQANHSLRGTIFRYLTHNARDDPRNPDVNVADLPAPIVERLVVAVEIAGALVLLAALWKGAADDEARLLDLSLIMTAMLVGSPHTQRIYFSALVVPAGVLAALLLRHASFPGRSLARAALVLVGLVGTALPLVLSTRRVAVAFEALSPNALSVLVLGVSLVVVMRRWKRLPPGSPAERDWAVASGADD